MDRPSKICPACGRSFDWRKKWERNWSEIKYCSDACRRHRINSIDLLLEAKILQLLSQRKAAGTICPSEAARAVRPDDWHELMEPARRAARRLCAQKRVVIMQNGRRIDPSAIRGPIRIQLI